MPHNTISSIRKASAVRKMAPTLFLLLMLSSTKTILDLGAALNAATSRRFNSSMVHFRIRQRYGLCLAKNGNLAETKPTLCPQKKQPKKLL